MHGNVVFSLRGTEPSRCLLQRGGLSYDESHVAMTARRNGGGGISTCPVAIGDRVRAAARGMSKLPEGVPGAGSVGGAEPGIDTGV
jgi:hypothetical protein